MKAAIRNNLTSDKFESGDVVVIEPDNHIFSDADLRDHSESALGDIDASSQQLLITGDLRFKNIAALSGIGVLRNFYFKFRKLRLERRRKYKLNATNQPELKG